METRVARFHNVYGPLGTYDGGKEKAPAAICRKVALAKNGGAIEVWGDGQQTRSFCYIDDLVDGMLKMMASDKGNIGPVNLGNPVEFKIIELAELVIKLTNSKSKIINKELPADDPIRRKPEISLAKRVLDWEPKVEVIDGLKETIDYFKLQL